MIEYRTFGLFLLNENHELEIKVAVKYGEQVEIPTDRALREGIVVGLANHTLLIRKDGSETPIDDSAAPIRDGGGGILGCVLVFRDISERKATERALDGARSRLELIVTDMAIPTMVYVDDAYAGEVRKLKTMWLEPGVYKLEVRDGDRKFARKIYVLSGKTLDLKATPTEVAATK